MFQTRDHYTRDKCESLYHNKMHIKKCEGGRLPNFCTCHMKGNRKAGNEVEDSADNAHNTQIVFCNACVVFIPHSASSLMQNITWGI
jgi:hypothetical protein